MSNKRHSGAHVKFAGGNISTAGAGAASDDNADGKSTHSTHSNHSSRLHESSQSSLSSERQGSTSGGPSDPSTPTSRALGGLGGKQVTISPASSTTRIHIPPPPATSTSTNGATTTTTSSSSSTSRGSTPTTVGGTATASQPTEQDKLVKFGLVKQNKVYATQLCVMSATAHKSHHSMHASAGSSGTPSRSSFASNHGGNNGNGNGNGNSVTASSGTLEDSTHHLNALHDDEDDEHNVDEEDWDAPIAAATTTLTLSHIINPYIQEGLLDAEVVTSPTFSATSSTSAMLTIVKAGVQDHVPPSTIPLLPPPQQQSVLLPSASQQNGGVGTPTGISAGTVIQTALRRVVFRLKLMTGGPGMVDMTVGIKLTFSAAAASSSHHHSEPSATAKPTTTTTSATATSSQQQQQQQQQGHQNSSSAGAVPVAGRPGVMQRVIVVRVTAQIMKVGAGTPTLRKGVHCIRNAVSTVGASGAERKSSSSTGVAAGSGSGGKAPGSSSAAPATATAPTTATAQPGQSAKSGSGAAAASGSEYLAAGGAGAPADQEGWNEKLVHKLKDLEQQNKR